MRRITIEEYLEKIHELELRYGSASTGAIAEEMDIRPPSVTQMLQKLGDEGLVVYHPYQGAKLTPEGEVRARELENKHKVLSEFFQLIGVDEPVADEDACRIEHHVSRETIAKLHLFIHLIRDDPDGHVLLERFFEMTE